VVWDANNGSNNQWESGSAIAGQCGTPSLVAGSFYMSLTATPNNTNSTCVRNIALLMRPDRSNYLLLNFGQQYTISFHYIDGDSNGGCSNAPLVCGMGYDQDARSLIFQIHQLAGGGCMELGFDNGGVIGNPQQWNITNCANSTGNPLWRGNFVPGETDDWKIVITAACDSTGTLALYRNGVQQSLANGGNGANVLCGSQSWISIGPYKWRWQDGGLSNLNYVQGTFNNLLVTTP
jgi:hypothetical protein